jgi:hypothetical protein
MVQGEFSTRIAVLWAIVHSVAFLGRGIDSGRILLSPLFLISPSKLPRWFHSPGEVS